ncbi:uncharacterized protein N7529_007844 [Penicillium soppii]|uniref:uncharacterized protein n=1 Tax=Penicillium soppii TaxID=69789 RepID=UPI0025473F7F|nr:uncharacterized protein N7529_007844 [Penicillium soppii]KAJ5860534.1 hypothetical protein N7529_007844 [Penicillium soppii]
MAPRSQLEITTSSVIRLVKEEASYHKELADQIERVKRLEAETAGDDENREYMLKQEHMAIEETRKVFPSLRQKLEQTLEELGALVVEEGKKAPNSSVEQITAAKEAIAKGKKALIPIS